MCTMTMTKRMASRDRNHPAARDFRPRSELSATQRRRVRRVRQSVRAGEYENDLKLEVAVARLLEKLLSEM